jgi:uncharacterized protein (TIGR02099 family)
MIRRVRLWLSGLFALGVILLGLAIGVTQLVLPWIVAHPEKIAATLADKLHRPVTIDRVDSHWERTGPLLNLTGVHLGVASNNPESSNAQPLTVASVGLKVNFFAWARRNASWTEFRVAGVDLDLVRDADGHWSLRGMDASGGDQRDVDDNALFALGTLVLRDVHLSFDDVPNNRHNKYKADELRLINHGDQHRVLSRVVCLDTNSPPIDVVLEYNSSDHSGRGYFGGNGLDLPNLQRGYPFMGLVANRGKGRVQVWATLRGNELDEARAEVDLTDLVLTTSTSIALDANRDIVPHIGIDRVTFGARWRREDDGWSADVVDLAITRQGIQATPGALHVRARAGGEAPEYLVSADALDIGTFASVAMLVDTLPAGGRRWLYAGNPEGTLSQAKLRYSSAQNFDVMGKFDALEWHSYARIPSFSGFSGVLYGDQDAFSVDLPQHNAIAVSVPKVFRQPLEFSELSGSIAAYRTADAWRIETDALSFEGATPGKEFGGEARGAVEIQDDGSKPLLDLAAVVTHGEVPASHLFWPINIMPPPAVSWLDRGLDAGKLVSGRAVFRGDLDDWPFRNNAGRFEALAEIDDLRLKYLNDWPVAEHVHATANFVNTSLHLDAAGGSIQGNKVNTAAGEIPDLGDGPLDLTINAQGGGRDLLGFVRASPLGTRFAAPLQGVDVTGQGKVDVKLHLPYKHIEDYTLDGTAQLTQAELIDPKYSLRFDNATGPVRFNRSGFSADALATTFRSKPAKFSLAAGGYVADSRHVVEGKVETRLPVRDVLSYAPALNDYQKYTSGDSDWVALFSVDREAAEGRGQRLTLTSDLRGVAIDLPKPLAKSAASPLPLSLTLTLPFIGADMDLRLGDLLRMRGRLPAPMSPFVGLVDFGGGAAAPASALPKSGVVVGGVAPEIDLSGWTDFASTGTSGSDSNVIERVALRSPSLLAWERSFGEGEVKLTPGPDAIEVVFDGANIAGSVNVPRKDLRQRGVSADLKRLYWPAAPEPEPGAPAPDDTQSPLNPANVPPLHVRIGDFHLGKATYGAATVEAVPILNGMHFDQVTSHSNNIDMRAHGDWTLREGKYHRSTFGFDLSAQDLGKMLDALGYAGVVDGGRIVAHIDASWAGTPSNFALNKINGGALRVNIAEGRIPDIELGAGRIAGLLNLAAIPRRLAFDFGDLFNKGYSFDSIVGTFTLHDGYAYTENLEVRSPTADMRLKGSMGLKTRDWDQRVEVTPHLGAGTLAIGGALIGGPVGAAAGAVLGGILKTPINAVTRAEYKVTGSWDKPVIAKVSTTVQKSPVAPRSTTQKAAAGNSAAP